MNAAAEASMHTSIAIVRIAAVGHPGQAIQGTSFVEFARLRLGEDKMYRITAVSQSLTVVELCTSTGEPRGTAATRRPEGGKYAALLTPPRGRRILSGAA